ncbi:MAG: hypothetical protein HPY66_1655 [Firmicutes bacterium]|nr:hypothetical protein [Bacillota bacterium]
MAKATAEQLKIINKFAKEPLTEENALVHGFRMIGTRLIEDRYLKIDKSLLDVYLQDVKNGDVVQIADHSMGGIKSLFKITLPFGRFFDGELTEEGGETHLDGYMYMKANQKTYVEPLTTDDIDEQLDAGTLHDSSVGIAWDISECSICGNDIRDYQNCPHYPGQTYKVKGTDYLCYIIAKPAAQNSKAYMAENSLVGVGAYPDAGHLAREGLAEKPKYRKVNDMLELKLIPQEEPVFCLFSANHTEILTRSDYKPDAAKLHSLYHKMYTEGLPDGMSMRQLTQRHTEAVEKLIMHQDHYLEDALDGNLPGHLKAKSLRKEDHKMDALIAEIFSKANIDPAQIDKANEQGFVMKDGAQWFIVNTILEPIADKKETDEKLAKAEAKIAELEPLAKDGEAFRKEVIEAAIADGVRAQGNDFSAETWKNTFATMTIQAIRDIGKTFKAQAEAEIPAGRKTVPGNLNKQPFTRLPDEAYGIK